MHLAVRYSFNGGQRLEQAAPVRCGRYPASAKYRDPFFVALNAIGNAVVRTIEIEPANGTQLGQSGDEPRIAADRDSRARTHLANERTFLAWLRTGLSLVAVGLAAAGFLPVDLVPGVPYVRSFSILLVLSGTAMVMFGASRYLRAYKQIETGAFNPAGKEVVTIAALIAVLGILAIPLVLLLR
ncbi:MAG: putative rane protein [Thermomicrobiales bacterium]|nr:putative rane protein [Thermomicrobiales bacterium]